MPTFEQDNPLTGSIIGAAIAVHKSLGPGLLESVYAECVKLELAALGLKFACEVPIPIVYRGVTLSAMHRMDLVVEDQVVVELKAVDSLSRIHEAQLLTYLRLAQKRLGLLINFNVPHLRDGLKRFVL